MVLAEAERELAEQARQDDAADHAFGQRVAEGCSGGKGLEACMALALGSMLASCAVGITVVSGFARLIRAYTPGRDEPR